MIRFPGAAVPERIPGSATLIELDSGLTWINEIPPVGGKGAKTLRTWRRKMTGGSKNRVATCRRAVKGN